MPPRTSPPPYIEPMKALAVEAPPSAEGTWTGEIKYDGFRAVALVNGGVCELWSRTRKPLEFPEISEALARLKTLRAVLDGEVVVMDKTGRSHFQLLQDYSAQTEGTLIYYVFDLLWLNGESLLKQPLEFRRKALEKILSGKKGIIQLSPQFQTDPATLLEASRRQGLEGIILKQRGSLYEPGRRSGTWLKVKNLNEQEFVIGGFTQPRGSRLHFGALLVGYYDEGAFRYAGKVGTGFDAKLLKELAGKFSRLERPDSPFADLPRNTRTRFGTGMGAAEMARVTWLKPQLVAQIKFAEWTGDGLLRQPVYLGLRKDKRPREVVREKSAVGRVSD